LAQNEGLECAAVKREDEEESGKMRGKNHDLGTPGLSA
jgi:hypothetical protein